MTLDLMQKKYVIFIGLILLVFLIGGFEYLFTFNKIFLIKNDYPVFNTQKEHLNIQNKKCQANDNAVVTKVIDGDTVVVENEHHVRILGIDADEKSYPCYNSAKIRLQELVLNKKITLEKDITDVDQYGRCLRTIFIGGQNIGLQLIKEGLAIARFYKSDIKYKNELTEAEKQAIENNIGCKWSDT